MGIFYNPSEIMNLVPFFLIICETSKQHNKNSWNGFYKNTKALGGFYKACFLCMLFC